MPSIVTDFFYVLTHFSVSTVCLLVSIFKLQVTKKPKKVQFFCKLDFSKKHIMHGLNVLYDFFFSYYSFYLIFFQEHQRIFT